MPKSSARSSAHQPHSRGEYRPVYASLLDDPDFQRLSDSAKLLLIALKLSLGPVGFGVFRKLVLCEQLNWSLERLEETLVALEKPKRDKRRGWIRRGENRVWIINGLQHEPQLSPDNGKHRTFIRKCVQPLDGGPLFAEFREHYSQWFDDASPEVIDSLSDDFPGAMDNPSDIRTTATDTAPVHGLPSTSTTTADGNAADFAAVRQRFLEKFYAAAPEKRKRDVAAQLDAALCKNGKNGALLERGDFRYARDETRLSQILEEVIEHPPDKADSAIVFVLRKLPEFKHRPPNHLRTNGRLAP